MKVHHGHMQSLQLKEQADQQLCRNVLWKKVIFGPYTIKVKHRRCHPRTVSYVILPLPVMLMPPCVLHRSFVTRTSTALYIGSAFRPPQAEPYPVAFVLARGLEKPSEESQTCNHTFIPLRMRLSPFWLIASAVYVSAEQYPLIQVDSTNLKIVDIQPVWICSLRAWVRAADLTPSSITLGEAR